MGLADVISGRRRGRRGDQVEGDGGEGFEQELEQDSGAEGDEGDGDPGAAASDDAVASAAGDGETAAPKTAKELKIERMLATLQARMESKKEELKQVQERSAARAAGSSAVKKTKDDKPPANVAEMFPRHKYAGQIWAHFLGAAVQDGDRLLSKVSINKLTQELATNRTTVKGVIKAFVAEGILVDTTPALNESHTYEVKDPFAGQSAQPAEETPPSAE